MDHNKKSIYLTKTEIIYRNRATPQKANAILIHINYRSDTGTNRWIN